MIFLELIKSYSLHDFRQRLYLPFFLLGELRDVLRVF